jgi:hypothetical protein
VISVPPEILEAVGRHFCVADGVLDVFMTEIMLQGSCVVAVVCELEPTGMAKHVWVDWEWHLGGLAEALDEPMETDGTDSRSETNTWASVGYSRRSLRRARISSPRMGCMLGIPFLTR